MKKLLLIAPLALCLCGCPLTSRDKQEDTHKDEQTETTKTIDVTNTPTGSHTVERTVSKKTADTSAKTHEEISSPALDHAAASLEALATTLANAYAPGSGGLVSSAVHALGLNPDTAATLSALGAAGAGVFLHRRGKKKGHEEAKKQLPKLP
jgi:Flp pilus assembly protein TadD